MSFFGNAITFSTRKPGFTLLGVILLSLLLVPGIVGFKNIPGLVHEGVPQEVFFALPFDGHAPQGIVEFHEGFKADC